MARARLHLGFALTVLILVSNSPRAAADCEPATPAAHINLFTLDGGFTCMLPFPPAGGLMFVRVELNSIPISRVRFSMPNPPFGTLLGGQWNYPTTGDLATGLEFDLGGCVASPVLGNLLVVVPAGLPPDCQPWKANDGAEAEDCDGNVLAAASSSYSACVAGASVSCCLECCYPFYGGALPPYNLSPPDGATGMPLNLQLSWEGTPAVGSNDYCFVEIGTAPDCANWAQFQVDCDAPFAPDFLQPGATYYWHVISDVDGRCHSVSATHSFTIDVPLSTRPATWGRVKAMYRN